MATYSGFANKAHSYVLGRRGRTSGAAGADATAGAGASADNTDLTLVEDQGEAELTELQKRMLAQHNHIPFVGPNPNS